MYRSFVAALLLVLAGLTQAQTGSQAGNWIKHDSAAGGFTALFPVAPQETSDTKSLPQGNAVSHLYMATTSDFICMAAYTDYPMDVDTERELALDRDNFAKEVHATVTDSHRRTFPLESGARFQALDFVATNDNGVFKGLIVVVNRRAYLAITFNRKGSNREADSDRFFTSFKLTGKKS
ncbi:MAG TPA: hypothetical protein VKL40_14190 [Candidatus Angelobacter sp.]|nr:hypothetical protein [Candidatus Angelobacter sp.]